MSPRPRLAAILGAILLLALVAWWATRAPTPNSDLQSPNSNLQFPNSDLPSPSSDPPAAHHLLIGLNAPDGTITRDLTIVAAVFDAWRTNFTRDGHPVGENHEITAALNGLNPLGLILLPAEHPAINALGQWCDRWGTPYFFHQISGTAMELRSAGPDRRFYTADDALWSPAPDEPAAQD
jgi:hypothetical protein